ncbi:hypothetical protein B0H11DRAFT_1909168 [Mycena galericulata]|nr:hypothetical protein B0H11DRAFT_1909168 [Mycena galericulata]
MVEFPPSIKYLEAEIWEIWWTTWIMEPAEELPGMEENGNAGLDDAGVMKEKDGWFKDVYCVCTLQSNNYRLKTRMPALICACIDSCNSELAPRTMRRLSLRHLPAHS